MSVLNREHSSGFSGATPRVPAGKHDPLFFLALLCLVFLGLLVLYPASAMLSQKTHGDAGYVIFRQLRWFGIGLVGLFALAIIPLETLRRLALPGLFLAIILLSLVFVPGLGHSVQSSNSQSFHRWLALGSLTFQPSEFAKPAIILYLADFLSRENRLEEGYNPRRLLLPLGLTGCCLGLIVLEPQFGTALCLVGVIAAMIFISGFPIIRLALIMLCAAPFLYLMVLFAPYRLNRLKVWLDPLAFRHEGGYQLVTAYRAFRDGGFSGTDLAQGFAHRYLTYGHTDFVFAMFGEDYGLLGITCLLVLLSFILWRGLLLLRRIDEAFPFILGVGALILIFFQTLLNMLVVTGLTPTTGVSLPFFSYGGSSLIVSMALAGILINVSRYAARPSKS